MFLRKMAPISGFQGYSRLYTATSSMVENSVALRINKLKSFRLPQPQEEFKRLESNDFVNERLSQVIQLYDKESIPFFEWNKIAYSRFLELFEMYRNDHFVLSHGQSGSLHGLAILNGVLLEARRFKPLLPFQVALGESTQFDNTQFRSATWYKENITHDHTDRYYKDVLVSVDAWPLSIAQSESALSFFSATGNRDSEIKEKVIQEAALRLIPGDRERQSNFIAEFKEFDRNVLFTARTFYYTLGLLYGICVPKKMDFDDYAYLSGPCGIAFQCQARPRDILENLQKKIWMAILFMTIRNHRCGCSGKNF